MPVAPSYYTDLDRRNGELNRKRISGIMLILLLANALFVMVGVPVVVASGTIYIQADGTVNPPSAPIQRNGDLYTFTDNITDSIVIQKDNIVVDGAGHILQGSGYGTGISLTGESNVTIQNVEITTFLYGIYLHSSSSNSIFGSNITANSWYGIYLDSYSDYNSISGNNITANNYHGILLDSSNNGISGNNITANNDAGICLTWSSSSNSISGNNITANIHKGIFLGDSDNNSISGNNITSNDWYGIYLDSHSDFNSISGNNITNHGFGILLYSSDNNGISGNNITANNYGICLTWSSSSNSISGNNIANNEFGIGLTNSDNNSIYHNNFESNTQQTISNSINMWDDGYRSGGNYWSDYTDTDVCSGLHQNETGSDGFWDHPYATVGDGWDIYPLVKPWVPFENQTIHIRADGSIDPSGAPIHRSGDLYTLFADITSNIGGIIIERNNMTLDGVGYTLQGSGVVDSRGIDLTGRNEVTIKGIRITAYDIGIFLSSSTNQTIVGNTVANSTCGIALGSSSGSSVVGNNITANIDFGILLVESSGNEFYHNNFVDNIGQVFSLSSVNLWDDGYPSGGNYWSDFVDSDAYHGSSQNLTGVDGIWDHSYSIDASNIDNYPLTTAHIHDVGLLGMGNFSRRYIDLGYCMRISAEVANIGMKTETFSVTICLNGTVVGATEVTLAARSSTVINVTCAFNCLPRGNYTISAAINPILGEAKTSDNSLRNGWLTITKEGDLGSLGPPLQFYLWDGKVDGKDLQLFLMLLVKGYKPPPPPCPL